MIIRFYGTKQSLQYVIDHYDYNFINSNVGICIHNCFLCSTKATSFIMYLCACVCAHLYSILCNLIDCSLPGSSVHGIFQERILGWIAISYFRGCSKTRDQTFIDRHILYH